MFSRRHLNSASRWGIFRYGVSGVLGEFGKGQKVAIRRLILALISLVFLAMFIACSGTATNEPQRVVHKDLQNRKADGTESAKEAKPEPRLKKDEGDDIMAKVYAEECILKFLKAPSTAKFPWFTSKVFRTKPLPLSRGGEGPGWKVTGEVDSQNSFGAMLRSSWVVLMAYSGDDNFELCAVTIGDNVSYVSPAFLERNKEAEPEPPLKKKAEAPAPVTAARPSLENTAQAPEAFNPKEKPKVTALAEKATEAASDALKSRDVRKWRADDDSFEYEAKLKSIAGQTVALLKADGSIAKVEYYKLCEADREYIDAYKKSRQK